MQGAARLDNCNGSQPRNLSPPPQAASRPWLEATMALFASTWAAFLAPLPTSMATLLGGNRLALMPASRTLLPLCQQSYVLRFCGWQPSTANVSAASYAKPCSLRATRILSILTLTPSLQLGSKLASISCFNSWHQQEALGTNDSWKVATQLFHRGDAQVLAGQLHACTPVTASWLATVSYGLQSMA